MNYEEHVASLFNGEFNARGMLLYKMVPELILSFQTSKMDRT